MKLSVDQIPDEGLELDYSEAADSFDYLQKEDSGSGVRIEGPIHVTIRVQKRYDGTVINGQLAGSAFVKCSRCLDELSENISHDFSYNCLPEKTVEEEEELSRESADICYLSGGEIDVTALVQEQVALALPMRPLCKHDCRGLCPVCGANLNKGDCGCKKETGDLRLAVLKKGLNILKT